MRKAGWKVWLAYDIEGSFEEGPPTLIDSAKRDRVCLAVYLSMAAPDYLIQK